MISDRTVLLVEDNEDDVILVKRALRRNGVDAVIQVACDGEEAVDYLAGTGNYQNQALLSLPAVILLDLKLPKKSGLEVLAWIKDNPAVSFLPVVVFTTSVESADIRQAYALGANSYLKKPYTAADTSELLKTLSMYWLDYNVSPLP